MPTPWNTDGTDEPMVPLPQSSSNPTYVSTAMITDMLTAFGYKYDSFDNTNDPTTNTSGNNVNNDDDEQDDGSFDNNHEYDDDDDDVDVNNIQSTNPSHPSTYTTVLLKNKERKQIPFVYVLGSILHPVHEYHVRKQYEASLFWFTYRYDFPEIKPYGITTDAGWGCMLRSAQMLLAHTLRIHFQSRHWQPPLRRTTTTSTISTTSSSTSSPSEDFVSALLTWFADFPSKTESFYSLHNMCAAGLANYEVLPGEWYGPGTACHVLRDLVSLHQRYQSNLFRVHVSSEGTVYREAVFKEMTKDGRQRKLAERKNHPQQSGRSPDSALPFHPLDPSLPPDPNNNNNGNGDDYDYGDLESMVWDTSLLLLIPLRLGLHKFNEEYVDCVAKTFALPQSVGILGGRPRGARWFYGAYGDGSKVLGLDPHTVQPAPKKRQGSTSSLSENAPVDMSDEYVASVQTRFSEVFDLKSMDPSIALGFYCRTRKDFDDLQRSLQDISRPSSSSSSTSTTTATVELVSFLDKIPKYLSPEAVDDMTLNELEEDGIGGPGPKDDHDDDASDEDEYVML